MSDQDIRRRSAAQGDSADAPGEPRQPDSIVSALRDIPRLRSIEAEGTGKDKVFRAPPPMVSRISGMLQGCGGVLLLLMALVMMLSAFAYGFYLWGPGLLLAGGVVLISGTIGVWRGQRVPVIVSIVALVMAVTIGYMWETFITISGRLTPLGGIGVMVAPAAGLIALLLVVALLSNAVSLIYWKRLFPSTARGAAIWVGGSLVLVLLMVILHFTQQQQRNTWISDHLDEWRAEAATDSLLLGSNVNVTLGYTFTTQNDDDDTFLDVHMAELQAAVDAGAELVRLTASGDMLLEAEMPVIFDPDEDKTEEENAQDAQARIERQRALETQYMAVVDATGVDIALADYQYSPYLLMRSYDTEEKTTWVEFVDIQEARVRHYAEQYQPAYYEIINEPSQYEDFSAIEGPEGENEIDAWVAQLIRLSNAVHEVSPDTQVGISFALQQELDEDLYVRALDMDEIDFIGFRMFQPAAFEVLEEMFEDLGHPADYGKEAWIMETWFGACLAPQRSQKLDGKWLEMTAAFAAKERMTAMLASDFGCFVNEGGTRVVEDPDLEGRTEVWETWRDLLARW